MIRCENCDCESDQLDTACPLCGCPYEDESEPAGLLVDPIDPDEAEDDEASEDGLEGELA
jgi:hypothetical protein